ALAEIGEISEAVVAVIVVFLIDAPVDAGLLQLVGISRPGEGVELLGIVLWVWGFVFLIGICDRPLIVIHGQATRAAPQMQTVRRSRPEDGAVIGVAD